MKKLIILCILILVSYTSYSQRVIIRDIDTGSSLEMVSLSSESPRAFATTGSKGIADISSFKGAQKISISSLGYKSKILSYTEIENLNFEVFLIPSMTQFDDIVVSATRWSQNSRNIPSKISIISKQDVALLNPQTAADLLGTSGEVFIQKSQQGGGSPMIRGFSTNRLLYTVDGVRMNSAIFRAGNLQNVISLDPFAIESTEVLFGPGSIIYGSDAIGGVMSFRTLTPRFALSEAPLITGNAVTRFSSANNEISSHFDLNIGWEKWASATSISHSRFGDLRMGSKGPEEYLKPFYVQRIDSMDRVVTNADPQVQNPTSYSQMNLMQKIRYSPNENWDFQYGFHYSETSEYSRYDRLIEVQPNGLPVSAVWNYGPQIWMMNNLSATHSLGNKAYDQMTLRIAHQYFQESRVDRRLNHHRLRTQREEVDALSVSLDFEKSVSKNRFSYGLEYVMNKVTSMGQGRDIRNGNAIPVSDRYPASRWSSYAGYLNYQYRASERLLLQAGVRYSIFNIQSDFTRHLEFFPFDFIASTVRNSATTANLGLVYSPTDTWKISGNIGTGFRAPNVDDVGKIFDFAAGEVVVPNTSLQAEYAYNGELHVSKVLGDRVKIDVTGFYTYLDKAMVRRNFQVNGQDSILYDGVLSRVFAIQNTAFGNVYGFNAGIEVKLGAGVSISSRYNYQIGKEVMENGEVSRSRHAAPAFGVTRLSYTWQGLTMQLNVVYSAQVDFENLNPEERQKPAIYATDINGNPFSPGWYALNFNAMYQFHKNFTVSSGIENITNQRYRPYSSGLVAAGRNFILSLRVNF